MMPAMGMLSLPCLALPCLALPCLALPCLVLIMQGGFLAAGQADASIELGSLPDEWECQRWGGLTVTVREKAFLWGKNAILY
jgi:hypothetical protein